MAVLGVVLMTFFMSSLSCSSNNAMTSEHTQMSINNRMRMEFNLNYNEEKERKKTRSGRRNYDKVVVNVRDSLIAISLASSHSIIPLG